MLDHLFGGFSNFIPVNEGGTVPRVLQATITPTKTDHPALRGVKPFGLHDEPYYKNRFPARSPGSTFTPLATALLPPEAPQEETVAWSLEREQGGRGIAIVMPHFYRNWQNDDLRKLVLNSICWTAGLEIPAAGMPSTLPALETFQPASVEPASGPAKTQPREMSGATHVTVRHEKGRRYGWPANGGIWSWGNEMLVQYRGGEFQDKPVGSHDINFDKPIGIEQSRSLDGGLTWTQHTAVPIQITEPTFTGPAGAKFPEFGPPLKGVPALTTPLNFADPNTILHFSWGGYLYHSPDRGVTWKGPFQLPLFDQVSWQLRTDYLVEDKNSVLAFWSGSKVGIKRNENGGMVYMVKTADGGLTWTQESLVSRVTEPSETRHDVALMPATVRASPTRLVCCIRNLSAYPKRGWIDCRVSEDNGRTWKLASTPVGDEAGTTPPALTRLHDGRLVLTYGYRKPIKGPTSIRAKISEDDGATWGGELILRNGGGDEDIGYTRNALRPDGKVVTIYYWQENEKAERDIAATIWTPPARMNTKAKGQP